MFQGFSFDCVPSTKLSYFFKQTYVVGDVGTHQNHRNETVILTPNYWLNGLSKKTFTILRSI